MTADAGPSGDGTGVRIGVLGPMRLEVDGVERSLTARRQRSILACLVLHVGEAVSADRLLHDVWGDDLPGSGVKAVAYQILKLRSLLGAAGRSVISTSTTGYRLDVDREHIDLHVMDGLVDRARAALRSDPHLSEALAERALGLCRGRPFTDVDHTFLDVEVQRLEGRLTLARRTLAEARLAQGRASDVVGDLDALLAEHPLEEAVAGLLMTALARAGRTADALRVYGDLRRRLGAELGIEPSGQLRELEQRLLTGDARGEPVAVGNLPTPLSSFVGREDDIAEITALLSSARLVSLASFGGAGKTRLAIEVAARLRERFADGVWFVDLVPISDPVLLPETFAASVGIAGTGARDIESHLVAALAPRHALIVVDNCEHLADEVGALVGRLLRHAPDIRILATGRTRLGVRDEVVWNVPPLPTATAAVDLFVQRAELVRSGSGTDADPRLVAEICTRLDGIPLAIELASARLRIMTVEQVAEHLADRFRLLVSTDRQADRRQRSLLATMTWSYDLLDDEERDLLRRMASCVDGFSLDAAVALSGDDRLDVVDRLERLVAAGLVIFTDWAALGRYRMLETVREFAAGRREPGDDAAAGLAHAEHYATVAAEIARLRAAGSEEWIGLGDRELGNLRAAMGWAFANEQARLGMAMAQDLWHYFWTQASGSNENVRWGRLALDLIDDDEDDVVLLAAGTVIEAYNLGDVPALELAADRVRGALDTARPPVVTSRLLAALATATMDTDPRAAEVWLDEAWSTAPGQPASLAILNNLIELSWLAGDLRDGAVVLERLPDALATSPGRPQMARKVEAGVAASAGRWEDVLRHTADLLGTDKVLIDLCLLRGEALGALGRHAEALAVAGDPGIHDYWADIQRVNVVGAAIELACGDASAAVERLRAVARATEGDDRRLALSMHVAALQAVAVQRDGDHDRAAVLFGFAAGERARLGIALRPAHRPLVDDATAACRAQLGDARFDELAGAGAATTWRDLVADMALTPAVQRP